MNRRPLAAGLSPRPIGVAAVGLGGAGEEHARTYARLADCRLLWVFDLDEDKTENLARQLGGVGAADSYDAILSDPLVGLVSLASYDDMHCDQIVAALSAGKHVFVEKPLCRSTTELHAIRQAWDRAVGRHLASNLILRGAPLYDWLHRAISSGELGEIYAFDGDYLYGRLHKITDGWRRDIEDYSVFQGGAVHLVDLMLWLTGERPIAVSAAGNRVCTKGTAFHYNDFVAATFAFESGLIGRITANFGCMHRHQHVVRVFGTKATFIYDDAGARLHTSREPGNLATPLIDLSPLPASKGDLISLFVERILDGSNGRAAAEREFEVMSACLAADEAVKTAQSVSLAFL